MLSKSLLAFVVPHNGLILPEQLEDWPAGRGYVRYESGDIVQTPEETSNLLLCLRGRHLADGPDFVWIYFDASLADNET